MTSINSDRKHRHLELRLREASEGAIPDPVARVIMSDLARTPLEVLCQGHPREARELSYLVDIPELERGDPAIEHGWDVDRHCLSAAAWRLERVFRDRDDLGRSPGVRAKLRKIAERLSEDLAEVLWGLSGGERFDGLGCEAWAEEVGSDFACESAPRPGSSQAPVIAPPSRQAPGPEGVGSRSALAPRGVGGPCSGPPAGERARSPAFARERAMAAAGGQ